MDTVCVFFLVNTSAHTETSSLEPGIESGQEDLVYTLFLRYTLDPNKLADWRAYAQAEFAPITESGGRITGYYAPTEFAGATSDAFATIDVGTMAEYETYRARLADHPKHKENVRKIEQSGAIHSTYRAIIQRVDPEKGA
jgi:NIPSNAP